MLLTRQYFAAFAAALLSFTCGCTAEQSPIVKATVTRSYSLEDKNVDRQHLIPPVLTVISDPEQAVRLGSYFPDLGLEKKARIAGGWIQFAEIEFERANGEKLSIAVDPDLVDWTEGEQGDFRTADGFGPYFLALLREAEAAKETEPKQDFVRATITRSFTVPDADGASDLLDQSVVTVVSKPEDVAKLAAFFPGAGQGKKSDWAGGWIPYAEIELERSNGETVRITFDPQFELWAERENGHGDWPLDSKFQPYFLSLLKETDAVPPAEAGAQFLEATIERFYTLEPDKDDRRHLENSTVTAVDDPEAVAKLAAFFMGMGEGKESDVAAGWEEFAKITFVRPNGDEVPVSVSFYLEEWSEGEGDWPLSRKFEPYFLDLLRKAESAKEAAAQSTFQKVTIKSFYTLDDTVAKRKPLEGQRITVLDDARQIARLASFFPDAGTGKESNTASLWYPFAEMEFVRDDGEPVKVQVSADFSTWDEGDPGDWDLPAEFGPYFLKLLKTAQSEMESDPQSPFVKATVDYYFSLEDKEEDRKYLDERVAVVVEDPEEVIRLASFFEHVGRGKESDLAGAWEACAEIVLVRKNGDEVTVALSFDLQEWSEGQGDWPLSRKFEPYFLDLLRSKE